MNLRLQFSLFSFLHLLLSSSLLMLLFSCSLSAQTYLGAWNPVAYPAQVGIPGWEYQDDNAAGTMSDPYASWSHVVDIVEMGGTNQTVTILPDAYIEAYDYDNADGDNDTSTDFESTLGHNLATELNININHNGLTIDGSTEGCYTVFDNSANGTGSLFASINSADNITIRGLYLLNGYAGAFDIANSTNIVFEDCVFDNNDLNGVEAFNITSNNASTPTSVTFTRCKFINNNHNNTVFAISRGSGAATVNVDFTDCVWSCNSATAGGTAIKVTNDDSNPGPALTFSGCTFATNTTTGSQGGAIWFDGARSVSTFTNTDFINNSTSGANGGGAIFMGNYDDLTFTNCNFYGNTSTNLSADGGAIAAASGSAASGGFLTMTNCQFDSNSSTDDGGCINMRYTTATLDEIYVVDNTAGDGLITLANNGVNLTISNYTCTGNTAPDGCVYNRGPGTLTDNGGSFSGTIEDLSTSAPSYDCGVYCAINIPATCTAVSQGTAICAASGSINISGEVWQDMDGDGIQEAGDTPLANVFVLLYDANGNLVGRTNTDGSGQYAFNGLPTGTYTVTFVNPSPSTLPYIPPANADTETTDSDITNSTTNSTSPISTSTANVDGAFSSMALPVELVHFSATPIDDAVALKWQTSYEINNAGFYVEYSTDARNWNALTFVAASMDNNSVFDYEFLHQEPIKGVNYYRLKQVDLDGTFDYSNNIAVRLENQQNVQVYPNPIEEAAQLYLESDHASSITILVVDAAGKEVITETANLEKGANTLSLSMSEWETGIYYLQIVQPEGTKTIRLIKL